MQDETTTETARRELTFERAHELLSYDSESGEFRWRVARRGVKLNKAAGCFDKKFGYIRIRIDSRLYMIHRIAWLLSHKKFPENEIDHINGDRKDNRICNLRDVTSSENNKNMGLRKDNTSGTFGVSWYKSRSKWHVRIRTNNVVIHGGYFASIEDAIKQRNLMETTHGFSDNHGRRPGASVVVDRHIAGNSNES